jgi:hypothetical protein
MYLKEVQITDPTEAPQMAQLISRETAERFLDTHVVLTVRDLKGVTFTGRVDFLGPLMSTTLPGVVILGIKDDRGDGASYAFRLDEITALVAA